MTILLPRFDPATVKFCVVLLEPAAVFANAVNEVTLTVTRATASLVTELLGIERFTSAAPELVMAIFKPL